MKYTRYKPDEVVGYLTLQYKYSYRSLSGRCRTKWHCLCCCGKEVDVLETNFKNTKSCGCMKGKQISEAHREDLYGKRYSWLTVENAAPDRIRASGEHVSRWLCRCDCGNKIEVDGAELKKGKVKSCGCHRFDSQKARSELTGKIFNSILVEERLLSVKYGKKSYLSRWKCKCLECGVEFEAFGSALRRGQLTCGCVNSKGEYEAAKIFKELGINAEKSFSFSDLVSPYGNPLFFDFAIHADDNKLYLIEYQGIQHYIPQKNHFGDYQREITDPLKKEYCQKHGIPLFEIRYDEDLRVAIDKIVSVINANSVPSK